MNSGSDMIGLFSHVFRNFIGINWPDQNSRLHQAIRYCLDGEGKRVRANFVLLVCESYGHECRQALSSAVAVEMVHAYSLAHDDLPCMDNDDFRRGRPSLHRAFDECTALLAGDAILTDSMRVLVDDEFFPDAAFVVPSDRIKLVRELTTAAGGMGMVYGQDLDMYWTGRGDYDLRTLETIHRLKTGALIGAACAMGAIAAGAPMDHVKQWREFGVKVGLAFQAIDDAIDGHKATGKTPNKDKNQKKLTYMTLYGAEDVLALARKKTEDAKNLIPGNVSADRLISFVVHLLSRQA